MKKNNTAFIAIAALIVAGMFLLSTCSNPSGGGEGVEEDTGGISITFGDTTEENP